MLPPDRDWLCQEPCGTLRAEGALPSAVLAGSFNPLHDGHRRLAEVAAKKLGRLVAFEMSIRNVDKPDLDPDEISRRLTQFRDVAPVFITRAPTFEEKAKLFAGAVLVVGSDTAERIAAPRYYGNSIARRDRSLAIIREHACRFLVAGRTSAAGGFLTLGGIEIPAPFNELFEPIEEHEFRVDLSSSELRGKR